MGQQASFGVSIYTGDRNVDFAMLCVSLFVCMKLPSFLSALFYCVSILFTSFSVFLIAKKRSTHLLLFVRAYMAFSGQGCFLHSFPVTFLYLITHLLQKEENIFFEGGGKGRSHACRCLPLWFGSDSGFSFRFGCAGVYCTFNYAHSIYWCLTLSVGNMDMDMGSRRRSLNRKLQIYRFLLIPFPFLPFSFPCLLTLPMDSFCFEGRRRDDNIAAER